MMTKMLSNSGTTNLFGLVEESSLSRNDQEEERNKNQPSVVPYLPKECVSNILVRLPLDSLHKLRLVCKTWYNIIYSPFFIDTHLRRAETVLIFLRKGDIHQENYPDTFSVEDRVFQLQHEHFHQPIITPMIKPSQKFHIKFMEIKDGKAMISEFNSTCLGKIRAACNGLILLDKNEVERGARPHQRLTTTKEGELIIVNPVTRELSIIPLGTLSPPHKESYGLSYCKRTGAFKLFHLFMDNLNYVGCEIIMSGMRSWRAVNGPAFGLFGWFGYLPVSAIGALHWIPDVNHSQYMVSMTLDDEKFHKIVLPKSSSTRDRLVEMSGILSFVTYERMYQIDVWILRNIGGEDWTKKFSITAGCLTNMVPLYCSRFDAEMIFVAKDGSLFAYDFRFEVMKKIDMKNGRFPFLDGWYLPHVNSMASWRINRVENVDD